eukprot:TRINITY_DN26597_c0_g1_i1.p1 TRINITY_DN26597_c0_g1~~TRINITY_DN26597_c0_g1_i1.p1  ORF type:complete len:341 (+),score=96.62 TRINITY_DN26597_c0_g1_i1:38-1060(+)
MARGWRVRQGCADPEGWGVDGAGRTRRRCPAAADCRDPAPLPPLQRTTRIALSAALFGGGASYELCALQLAHAVIATRAAELPGLQLHLFIDRTVTRPCVRALTSLALRQPDAVVLWNVESRLTGWGLSAMAYRNLALELLGPDVADCVVVWDADDRPEPSFIRELAERALRPGAPRVGLVRMRGDAKRGFFGNFISEVPLRRRREDASDLTAALTQYYGDGGAKDCDYGSDERALTILAADWIARGVAEVVADARCAVWPDEPDRARMVEVGGLSLACTEFDERRAADREQRLAAACRAAPAPPPHHWEPVPVPGHASDPSTVVGTVTRLCRTGECTTP